MDKAWFRKIAERFRSPNFTCDICGREVFDGERVCRDCLAALPAIMLC